MTNPGKYDREKKENTSSGIQNYLKLQHNTETPVNDGTN